MANKGTWRSFEKARSFIHKLKLKNDKEWRSYCQGEEKRKKPKDVPSTPNIIYKDCGWVDLGDWLGTKNFSNIKRHQDYLSFTRARKIARSFKVKNRAEWQKVYNEGKIPENVPLKPERVYKDLGWVSCGDWFGTGYVAPAKRTYRTFTRARAFARKLGLNSRTEWEAFCRKKKGRGPYLPEDIPATPARIYKENGWNGWVDWLGKKKKKKS